MYEKLRKERLKREYREKVKLFKYWDKVDKMFLKMRKKNIETFSYTFKHLSNIFSKFQPDDEARIEIYANIHGYEIIDENLSSTKSVYTFQLS